MKPRLIPVEIAIQEFAAAVMRSREGSALPDRDGKCFNSVYEETAKRKLWKAIRAAIHAEGEKIAYRLHFDSNEPAR